MYRVIIVEDEEIIQRGLTCLVPWKKLGFEVAGVFWDGAEAYEWLQSNHCDVILTDIMMSEMNGLDLAKIIREERPNMKVVILSGYSEFDYARKAMQYGVVDYLVKPIDEDELQKVFAKLKAQMDEEKHKNIRQEELTAQCRILVQRIDAGDRDVLKDSLHQYMDRITTLPFSKVREILKELCSEIAADYKRRGIDVWVVTNGTYTIMPLYEQKDCSELYHYVLEMLLSLSDELAKGKQEEAIIASIKGFIQEHMSEDIGNTEIAANYALHPSYVSRIFKQKTGENISDYVMRVRMERAMELLKTGKYSAYEVSQMVGYNSQGYFATTFKKYTGYSPTDYGKKIRED